MSCCYKYIAETFINNRTHWYITITFVTYTLIMLSCSTFCSFPQYQKHTYIQRTAFQNQSIVPNCTSMHGQLKNTIARKLHQKMLPAISEQFYPSSMLRGKKMICKSTERPAWLDTKMPETLRPYFMLARLNRDIGLWLQVWPSYWYCMFSALIN
jgi:hypothetical protein